MNKIKQLARGFTIVELIIVISVIGILAAISIVAYGSIQASARDKSVQSDIDALDGLETSYGIKNNTGGKAYYSGSSPTDSVLGFTVSKGNVIDAVVDNKDYCIRGYNLGGTKKTIYDAYTKESSPGTCNRLVMSAQAIADSPGSPPLFYTTSFESGSYDGWTSGHVNNTVTLSNEMAHTGSTSLKSVQSIFWYTNDATHCGSPTASCGFTGDGVRNTLTGLTVGNQYVISAWVYLKDASSTRQAYWDNITSGGSSTPVSLQTNTWVQVSYTFTAGASSTYIYLFIQSQEHLASDTITSYIDDIQVIN